MSRRPRRNRPPRLDDLPAFATAETNEHGDEPGDEGRARVPTLRRALLDARITGPHTRLSRDAVRHAARALVNGDPRARLGCDALDGCTPDEVRDALVASHGWDPTSARAAIDPDCTLAGARAAAGRIAAAKAAGARVALATSRPASLLGLTQWIADDLADGATILESDRATIDGASGREVWWIGGVAVITDGAALLGVDGVSGADDWLFAVGRPDVVVADRGFAGAALRAGCEVIAWADLDAPALALAAARGRPVVVVPVNEQRPSAAYAALAHVVLDPQEPQTVP